jgi:hypothetical protein
MEEKQFKKIYTRGPEAMMRPERLGPIGGLV